ncbi:NADH-quinone oxidoreductase subunit D [Alloprevotella tannerae]|uniref:NADH-quinone oxidoreductase subunit D n=1 Tax=Alloprevotella tannerae TaxID=76122 RepID=UPI0028EC6722|nr:NADH-quinone oxidoreductase subunit D [Alloprevotella tannerae]
MQRLKDEEHFDFLETLTGMDWGEDGLGVVYNLWSTTQNKRISLKTATTDRENPFLPTVSDLWNIANIYEREVFDFFGIKFLGHPDMRRIFLREDWNGYPMRKDDKPEEENPLRMDNEPLADVTTQYDRQADGSITTKENTIFTEDDYVVNIGPQHPSTHGVLHFRVALEGERIRKIDPILGYIHRGIEKLNESLTYPQTLALTERLDYLGAMQNRHALCMCIEKAAGIEVSERVQYIRTIMDEFQRIDSHILFFSCLCQDMGATSAFLYGFRDREQILDIFEETCGGRLILNYNTIGGVMADIHPNFVRRVKEFIPYMRHNLQEYYDIFVNNVIAHNRLEGVGVLNKEQVISFGCTGGTGRAAGWSNDLRKHQPYAAYDKVDFQEIIYTEGDSFARLMVRMKEIEESLKIIEQLIDGIPEGPFQTKTKPIIKIPAGTYYSAVEGSRGEFGVLLESKGDKFPSRLHYRSTGLPLVAAMDTFCRDNFIADLMAIGGTVDYVVPDIDR